LIYFHGWTLQWQDIEKTTNLKEKGIDITDSCFEEILYRINFIDNQKFDEDWNKKICMTNGYKYWKENVIFILMCQYLYAVPGHNANVERIFLLIMSQWTKERNCLQVQTVESIIQCKFNFKMTCSEIHTYSMGKPELLKRVNKSEKYNISK